MRTEYKRDLQNNYLIIEVTEEESEDNYCLHMAEQNEIPGLLRFHSARRDGNLYLHYDITSKQTLDSIYGKRMMSCEDLLFVLCGIREVLDELQKYLLNPAQLIFDPQYIFVSSNRTRLYFCCMPECGANDSIALLAEFLLKRLNHEDWRAVELGYRFYQDTQEENFSLKNTLRELLSEEKNTVDGQLKNRIEDGADYMGSSGTAGSARYTDNAAASGNVPISGNSGNERNGDSAGTAGRVRKSGKAGMTGCPQNREYAGNPETAGDPDPYIVTHRERRKRTGQAAEEKRSPQKEKKEGLAERVFQIVHPAVLLSTLFLLVVLELLFYFGMVNVTEAGGIFFLLLSVEMLINQCWKRAKEKKADRENRWIVEENSEMYRMLQEEMYEMPQMSQMRGNRAVQEPVSDDETEETRFLAQPEQDSRMRLVCIAGDRSTERKYPDILVGKEGIVIGKMKGEADVILASPTVSRVHARLENRDGRFYVKDLNSRNGTFCNGERLDPQEQREFSAGSLISFAEIEYLAMQAHTHTTSLSKELTL